MYVPDFVKTINAEKHMVSTNEARHIKWHETFKCKCNLDLSVCNNKQLWNNDKCNRECKVNVNTILVIVNMNVNVINHVMLENI